MPFEASITAKQCCQKHSPFTELREPAARGLAEDIHSQLDELMGIAPLKEEGGLLELKERPFTGVYLAAAQDLQEGELLGVADCAVKLMNPHTLSSTEDSDFDLRYVHSCT